jgi:hypothetical protein
VKAAFGNQPDALADFGVPPKKTRAPLPTDKQAAANAKREATRAARKVMGAKQRKDVKGDVTGVTITPIAAAPPVAADHTAPNAPTKG